MLLLRLILLALIITQVPTTASAELTQNQRDQLFYGAFKKIERFGYIKVVLLGTAEKLELDDADLNDLLRLRFKNNFAGMKYEDVLVPYTLSQDDSVKASVGTLRCAVWTVREGYPVAFHVQCEVGNFYKGSIWNNSVLGVGTKEHAKTSVKRAINELIDDAAVKFFKVRGEM